MLAKFIIVFISLSKVETVSAEPIDVSYATQLLATINNFTCNRKWMDTFIISTRNRNSSGLRVRSRKDSYNFHKACKHEHPSWNFCVLDKSPFWLRWSFSSAIICEGNSTEIFHLFREDEQTYYEGFAKSVNLVHESINQDVFTLATSVQSKRRNYFNSTEGFVSITILAITLCQHLNASVTLLPTFKEEEQKNYRTLSHNHTLMRSIFESPTVYPRMFARTLTRLDRISFDTESSRYIRIDSVDFNFVYCGPPQMKSSSLWDFNVIFQAFEITVWLLLLALLLICSFILSTVYSYLHLTLVPSSALALFSGLLGGNAYFGREGLKYSVLFTVWMVTSMILSNYYTGSMTSLLIKPMGEEVMSSLSDLDKNNFTLIFTALVPSVFEVVNASAYGTPTMISKNTTNIKQYNQTAEMGMLRRTLGSSSKYHHLPIQSFLERVAKGKRKSAFGPWPYCLAAYNRVMAYIKNWNSQAKQEKDKILRHCHLGKKLVSSGGIFWGFLPPKNGKLAFTFQKFMETGIYQYWMEEFYGIGYASRVQDRSRVKSPTRIAEDSVYDTYTPLNLKDGHLPTIFFLWILGIICCAIVMLLEIAIKKQLYSVNGDELKFSTDTSSSINITFVW